MAPYRVVLGIDPGNPTPVHVSADDPLTASFRAGLCRPDLIDTLGVEVLESRPCDESDWFMEASKGIQQ